MPQHHLAYHIISYHIISYHIISYHIISSPFILEWTISYYRFPGNLIPNPPKSTAFFSPSDIHHLTLPCSWVSRTGRNRPEARLGPTVGAPQPTAHGFTGVESNTPKASFFSTEKRSISTRKDPNSKLSCFNIFHYFSVSCWWKTIYLHKSP